MYSLNSIAILFYLVLKHFVKKIFNINKFGFNACILLYLQEEASQTFFFQTIFKMHVNDELAWKILI